MRVVIAGGHGKIALILERLLTQLGDSVAGFIRNPDHAADRRPAIDRRPGECVGRRRTELIAEEERQRQAWLAATYEPPPF